MVGRSGGGSASPPWDCGAALVGLYLMVVVVGVLWPGKSLGLSCGWSDVGGSPLWLLLLRLK